MSLKEMSNAELYVLASKSNENAKQIIIGIIKSREVSARVARANRAARNNRPLKYSPFAVAMTIEGQLK